MLTSTCLCVCSIKSAHLLLNTINYLLYDNLAIFAPFVVNIITQICSILEKKLDSKYNLILIELA